MVAKMNLPLVRSAWSVDLPVACVLSQTIFWSPSVCHSSIAAFCVYPWSRMATSDGAVTQTPAE
jgi:hypothetical protein